MSIEKAEFTKEARGDYSKQDKLRRDFLRPYFEAVNCNIDSLGPDFVGTFNYSIEKRLPAIWQEKLYNTPQYEFKAHGLCRAYKEGKYSRRKGAEDEDRGKWSKEDVHLIKSSPTLNPRNKNKKKLTKPHDLIPTTQIININSYYVFPSVKPLMATNDHIGLQTYQFGSYPIYQTTQLQQPANLDKPSVQLPTRSYAVEPVMQPYTAPQLNNLSVHPKDIRQALFQQPPYLNNSTNQLIYNIITSYNDNLVDNQPSVRVTNLEVDENQVKSLDKIKSLKRLREEDKFDYQNIPGKRSKPDNNELHEQVFYQPSFFQSKKLSKNVQNLQYNEQLKM